jgi:hypothetical protein
MVDHHAEDFSQHPDATPLPTPMAFFSSPAPHHVAEDSDMYTPSGPTFHDHEPFYPHTPSHASTHHWNDMQQDVGPLPFDHNYEDSAASHSIHNAADEDQRNPLKRTYHPLINGTWNFQIWHQRRYSSIHIRTTL